MNLIDKMKAEQRIVLKFGGSVLHSTQDFPNIAQEVTRFVDRGYQVVCVVSAYFGNTEKLINQAQVAALDPQSVEFANLIASGEFESANDLNQFLNGLGLQSDFLAPAQIGFIADGSRDSAHPISIDRNKLETAFKQAQVLVVPGFSAIDAHGDCVLLGRGGSDISAVCIAENLGLERVRLLKDVDGIYDKDPNVYSDAHRLERVDYQLAQQIAGELIQAEAISFASLRGIAIEVSSIGSSNGSVIGGTQSSLDALPQVATA